jgi:hypothetical protein
MYCSLVALGFTTVNAQKEEAKEESVDVFRI